MFLRNSKFGKFYGCINYPKCSATHGAHPDGNPLGTPADRETKDARIRAHAQFDQLWRGADKCMGRKQAYSWLAEAMGLEKDKAHIGLFNKDTCEIVQKKVKDYINDRLQKHTSLYGN